MNILDLPIVIINPESYNGDQARKSLLSRNHHFIVSTGKDKLDDIVQNVLNDGFRKIFVCGGDGFVNNYLQIFMSLPLEQRSSISTGILPSGRANDLARELNQPRDVLDAYEKLCVTSSKKYIDLISVNGKYFVTGGGIGLSTETVEHVNAFKKSARTKVIADLAGHYIYPIFAGLLMVTGYGGVDNYTINDVHYDNAMIIAVQNQSSIGKNLYLAPKSRNDDGILDVSIIKRGKTFIDDLFVLYHVIKTPNASNKNIVFIRTDNFYLKTEDYHSFIGDGEILTSGKFFDLKVVSAVFPIIC